MSTPEISVQDFGEMLKSDQDFILLDVREPWELERAKWDDARLKFVPMSQLAQRGLEKMPEDMPAVVVCHHGIRSFHVTNWLLSLGLQNVNSLRGGIEAYALEVDASVGRY